MIIRLENENGTIYVNSDVAALIAGVAAADCHGVAEMASGSAANEIAGILKKDNFSKGVKISCCDDESIIIDLYIIVRFGTKISVAAPNIVERVKGSVEDQTGLSVCRVNLNIEGVKQ